MWSVVCFSDDNTIAAVPTFWINNNKCAWPKKSSRRKIERRVNPNELEFNYFKSKVLHSNLGSLLDAQYLAQENSGLSSNDNLHVENLLQKRTRKHHRSTERNNGALNIPSPPTHLNSEESDNNTFDGDDSDKDKTYMPIRKDTCPSSTEDNVDSDIRVDFPCKVYTRESPKFEVTGSSKKKLKMYDTNVSNSTHFASSSLIEDELVSLSKTFLSTPRPELENNPVFTKLVGIQRTITTLKYEIELLQKRQDYGISLMQAFLDKLSSSPDSTAGSIVYCDIICIDNYEDLEKMEEKLTTDRSYRNQVIVSLNRLVGDSLSETVRRIMQKLFSDNFLSQYSYIGFKGKQQFSTLQHCAVIFESIQQLKNFKDTPLKDIEKPIKLWMAQAPSRLKKLEEKKNK